MLNQNNARTRLAIYIECMNNNIIQIENYAFQIIYIMKMRYIQKTLQDLLDGFELNVLDYIKETNILQYVFKVLGKNTADSMKKIHKLFKDDTSFICLPILVGKHWTVAVISKSEINIFDPTLQTKKELNDAGQLRIGNCEQKIDDYLNEKPIRDEKGTICGLCSAEFIIETLK